jgi:predicted peptidase
MIKKVIALFVLVLISQYSNAQDLKIYEKHLFINKGDTLPYRLLLPENYDPQKKYPLILFLHGSGERGNDNEKQLIHGSNFFLRDSIRKNYPAIVVFPQCAANRSWSNVNVKTSSEGTRQFEFATSGKPSTDLALVINLINYLHNNYSLDKKQFYVGGLSMGGMGTFDIIRHKPKMFAAAFPICGGANPKTAGKLKRTSWWIFHGLKDDVVHPDLSKAMAAALQDKGADVKLTLYPEANHNSWDPAFAEKDLIPWMFSKKRK